MEMTNEKFENLVDFLSVMFGTTALPVHTIEWLETVAPTMGSDYCYSEFIIKVKLDSRTERKLHGASTSTKRD